MLKIPLGTRILLVYDPVHGVPMADGLAEEFVVSVVNSTEEYMIYTASSLVVDYFRLYVFRKQLSPKDIVVRFQDQEILVSAGGRFDNYPAGFCDHMENILMELI